jgi:uncharacterized protein YbaP (TraB family)
MKMRAAVAVLILLLEPGASSAASNDVADYAALPSHKAIATSVDDDSIRGVASGQPNDQTASAAALESCETHRETARTCEVTRLDDVAVTTGREIRAQVPKSPHPLMLWRFEHGAAIVYLAGSIHVMKPTLFPLPRQFEDAFRQANRLVVEVNTDAASPDVLQTKFREYALLPQGQTISTVLQPTTLALLSAHLESQAMAVANVASLRPAMLETQLAVARLSALGYAPQFGLEQHFMAAAGNRPVLELETIDQQLAVLTSPPMSVQDEMLAETIDQMDTIEPVIAAMVVAWFAGDEHEFRRLFDLETGDSPEIRAFVRRLLEDRNVGMAKKIVGYLQTPGTTFVLVGAAHLTGPEGIVALLEARGLKIHRINSNDMI